MNRRILSLVAAGAVLTGIAVSPTATAAPAPKDATWTEAYIPSGDGTLLHADVMLPKDRKKTDKHPVIVSIGPYFGTGSQNAPAPGPTNSGPSNRFKELWTEGDIFGKGYAYIQVDSRGYGGSQGCNDFGGKGEQMDAKAAVEWAAKQPWSTGKVGMWGKSYDAWTQVMALASKPKGLAATVIQAPINDGYKIAFENGVHWSSGWYVTPSLYHAYDLLPPTTSNSPEYWANWAQSTAWNPTCAGQNRVMTSDPNRANAYWVERDIRARAAASTVPTFWVHGFNDVQTKPTNIFEVYSALKGPKRAWFGQWDHVRGSEVDKVGREGFMAEAMNWFDHYLKGKPLKKAPPVEVQDGDGVWRSEKAWPAADAKLRSMPLKPGSYVDEDENSADAPISGTWSVSQPTPHDVRISGLPRLTVKATPQTPAGAPMVVQVYDVAPDNTSRLLTRGAYQLSGSEPVTFDLWPTDWLLRKGHRVAVQLSGSDKMIYLPNNTRTTVTIESGKLALPMLAGKRVSDLVGEEAVLSTTHVAKPKMQKAWFEGRSVKADFGSPAR